MIKNKSGSVINLSSRAAVNTIDKRGRFRHGKSGNERFHIGLAAEMAEHNIAVKLYLKTEIYHGTEGMKFWQKDPKVQATWDTTEMIEKGTLFLAQQNASLRSIRDSLHRRATLCMARSLN